MLVRLQIHFVLCCLCDGHTAEILELSCLQMVCSSGLVHLFSSSLKDSSRKSGYLHSIQVRLCRVEKARAGSWNPLIVLVTSMSVQFITFCLFCI